MLKLLHGEIMLTQFSRTEILIGKKALEKLHKSNVIVFGIGGVGGHAVDALVRSGVGHITLVDNDKFSLTNLNRQLFATHKTLGEYKVEAAKERLLEINPELDIKTYKFFYTHETSDKINLKDYNYIVDAIDTVSGKILLTQKAQEAGIPIISSMGAGNKMNPTEFEVTDIYKTSVCPLARVMRQELKKLGIKRLKVVYSKELPLKPLKSEEVSSKKQIPGSNAFVPSAAGLILASEVIKDLIIDNTNNKYI